MSRIGTRLRGFSAFASLLFVCAVVGAASAEEDSARGRELFTNCTQCHGVTGSGSHLSLAPAIAGQDLWYVEAQLQNFRAGKRADNPQDLPGLRMRPMSRSIHSDEDVNIVAAYVANLPSVNPAPVLQGGDPQRGAITYNGICAACHGADGAGNQAMGAPRLRHTNDWYLFSALQRFKAHIRGNNPPLGPVMQGMAASLADEQAIKDVVAYITTNLNQ
jgi:cbb3-type cytochrome c oxidase subunit III